MTKRRKNLQGGGETANTVTNGEVTTNLGPHNIGDNRLAVIAAVARLHVHVPQLAYVNPTHFYPISLSLQCSLAQLVRARPTIGAPYLVFNEAETCSQPSRGRGELRIIAVAHHFEWRTGTWSRMGRSSDSILYLLVPCDPSLPIFNPVIHCHRWVSLLPQGLGLVPGLCMDDRSKLAKMN